MSLEKSILLNVLNQEVVFEEYFCNLLKEEKFFNKFIDFISIKNRYYVALAQEKISKIY